MAVTRNEAVAGVIPGTERWGALGLNWNEICKR